MIRGNRRIASYSPFLLAALVPVASLIIGMLMSVEPLFVLIATIVAIVAVLSLGRPWLVVAVVLATRMPLNWILRDIQFGTGAAQFNAVGLQRVLIIAFTAIVLLGRIALGDRTKSVKAHLLAPVAVFALVLSLQVFRAPDRLLSFRFLINLLEPLALYLLVVTVASTRQVLLVISLYITSSLIPLGVGISDMLSGGQWIGGAEVSRVVSTANHPNEFAAYLVAVLLVSMGVLLQPLPSRIRILLGLVTAVGFCLLIFTFTRIAWASLAMGMAVFAVSGRFRFKFVVVTLLLLGTLGLLVSVLPETSQLVSIRLFHDTGSLESHLLVNRLLWVQFLLSPVLGHGLYSTPVVLSSMVGLWTTPHNDYLGFLSEMGIVGFASYIALLGVAARLLFLQLRNTKDHFTSAITLAASALFVAFLMFGLTDAASTYLAMYVWVMVGLAEAQSRIARGSRDNSLQGNSFQSRCGPQ